MRGEAEFHFASPSMDSRNSRVSARLSAARSIAELRDVMGIGADRFPSFCIERTPFHSPPPISLSFSFLPRRRIGRERSAVLPVEYKCVYDPRGSHPEIQTYLLRTAASPIIMRHEFNLSGPIVNTVRLDSRPGPIRPFRNRRDVSGTKRGILGITWGGTGAWRIPFIHLFIYLFIHGKVMFLMCI